MNLKSVFKNQHLLLIYTLQSSYAQWEILCQPFIFNPSAFTFKAGFLVDVDGWVLLFFFLPFLLVCYLVECEIINVSLSTCNILLFLYLSVWLVLGVPGSSIFSSFLNYFELLSYRSHFELFHFILSSPLYMIFFWWRFFNIDNFVFYGDLEMFWLSQGTVLHRDDVRDAVQSPHTVEWSVVVRLRNIIPHIATHIFNFHKVFKVTIYFMKITWTL